MTFHMKAKKKQTIICASLPSSQRITNQTLAFGVRLLVTSKQLILHLTGLKDTYILTVKVS